MDELTYGIIYQNASDNVSKAIMVVNIPMIAAFVFLMSFVRRRFYFDSLIFVFHFFSLYIFSWIMLDWVDSLIDFLFGEEESLVAAIVFTLFTFLIPLFYAILGMKKFLDIKWYWAIPAGIAVMVAVGLANMIYRFIIFVVTYWVT
jgi:hypothetical protein